jgi:CheY-like chemotaxis protein
MCKRVLTVDDDVQTTRSLKGLLEAKGFSVKIENDSTKVLATARAFRPDIVILDYLMPKAHGGDVAWQLASDPVLRHARVIMCSGVPVRELSGKLPPVQIPVLEKPLNPDALLQLLVTGSS